MRYDTRDKKARALTAAGYMQPSYSPDGSYFAATRTTALGTDVVILDARNGQQLLRITDDGASFAPTWSPAGDGIAFLHIVGQTVDLRLAKLDGSAPSWTVKETIDLTEVSGLDAASRPDWFIPPELLPATPPPSVAPSASTAPAAAARHRDRGRQGRGARGRRRPRRDDVPRAPQCTISSDRHGPVPRARSRPGRSAAGLRALTGGDRAIRRPAPRGRRSARRGGQTQPRLLRGIRIERDGRARTIASRASRATCRSSPTPSGATSGQRPPVRPSRCSTSSARTRSPSTRISVRRRSHRCSSALDRFAYVLCRTSNPGAGELQDLVRRRRRRDGRPAGAAPRTRRAAGRRLGAGRDGRARRRGDGTR